MNAWGANQSIYYYIVFNDDAPKLLLQPDVTVFLLERILVERVNSAVLMNLVVTCTVDCTCHHLTRNVYFSSEIWNLKQIKDLANRKCCSISLFKRCFSFLSKKYHWVVICHSDGTYNHPKYFGKNERLRSEPKHILLVFNDVAPKLLLPAWRIRFFCKKGSWSNELIPRTSCTDCTCHHLSKNVYFLSEISNLKQIKDLANRKCCSICLF